jgi:hypothetical protein
MFGTEDGEALKARMPWLEISGRHDPIDYLRNGFRIVIPYVAPSTTVSFHVALAFNHVDTRSGSECYAVDVPHNTMFALPVVKRLVGVNEG